MVNDSISRRKFFSITVAAMGAQVLSGKLLNGRPSASELKSWASSL